MFGWVELILILTIILVVYGAGKLPQLGEGVERQFKDSSDRYVRMRHPSVDAHPSAAEEKQKRGTTGSPRDDP
nr:twin-arginine translocase TatA/TatE family subunit [Nitrospira sp.]